MKLDPVVLENDHVRLEPLRESRKKEMRAALNVDPDAWEIMVGSAYGETFDAWWDESMRGYHLGHRLPYAVIDRASGQVAGTTGFFDIIDAHKRVEIGGTFYRPEFRGGVVNPACKRLLMGAAFDAGAIRVEMVTDALNARSRRALAGLGAVEEGTLRRHKVTHTGRVRDTVVFAVLDSDWPTVRAKLNERLDPRLGNVATS